jgi:hypothetical protein
MDNLIAFRRAVSEGLASWLTFEHHCAREGLFSERYLALPVAQLLSTNTAGAVIGEHNHPVLSVDGADGRSPQLDFVIRENEKITLVVETKWARSGISIKDVIWDCVRLELAAHYYGCDALFILAGSRHKVDTLLASPSFNPSNRRGKPSRVLHLNGFGRLSVNIQSPKWAFGKALHKQLEMYPHVAYARSFVCGEGTQVPKAASANAYTAAVWHIRPEAPGKRFTINVPAAARPVGAAIV